MGIYLGELILLDNNKCQFNEYQWFSTVSIFNIHRPLSLNGAYTQTGSDANLVINCSTTNGSNIIYVSSSPDGFQGKIATYLTMTSKDTFQFFNETAIKTIRDQWNDNMKPSSN